MKELTHNLIQFKQITLELIRTLQQDEINKLDDLLDSRQIIIKNIEKLQYTIEEFTDICIEFDVLNIEQQLAELMKAKKDDTRQELNKIQLTKNANNNYNKSFYNNVETFNKKI